MHASKSVNTPGAVFPVDFLHLVILVTVVGCLVLAFFLFGKRVRSFVCRRWATLRVDGCILSIFLLSGAKCTELGKARVANEGTRSK